jgi:glutamate synthase (NADPH/NADH) small chain
VGKATGFLEFPRKDFTTAPAQERIQSFKEFTKTRSNKEVEKQAARCMDCGTPFCNWGCPVDNLIPEFNDLVYQGNWDEAFLNLQSTNNFPEFTGRICPAPCEPACCTVLVNSAVTIKQIELSIIENAFRKRLVKAKKPKPRNNIKIAIIGSGPAGLAAAQDLNLEGYSVHVFEKNEKLGGLLRYGIPDFKLEKWVIDRRIKLLEEEGCKFTTNAHIGENTNWQEIADQFDYVALCCGAEQPRDIGIPIDSNGKNLKSIHYAMEFLVQQNRIIQGVNFPSKEIISAKDKNVIVLGGGDTGSDCIGTGIRQGCASMSQIQIHKKLPEARYDSNPWPIWPKTFSTSSSQDEGCRRYHSLLLEKVEGQENIQRVVFKKIFWPKGEIQSGQRNYEVTQEKVVLPCDLLLIALGFQHCSHEGLVQQLDLKLNARKNIAINNTFETSIPKIFAAGDMVEGANLVVTAIASGKKMAKAIHQKALSFA